MNKRTLLVWMFGLLSIFLFFGKLPAQSVAAQPEPTILKPMRLHSGDKVGLVAAASFITEKNLQTAIEKVEQLGLIPVYSDKILGKHGYFSGTDKERADDFNNMIKNPEIKGILFAAGGYGCTRIIDSIDYDMIKKNPKVIMGFSDNTALLNSINEKTGLITFHGPIARTIHAGFNREHFEDIIVNPKDKYVIRSSDEDIQKSADDKVYERYTITSGKAQGELVGGNLTLICSMLGTPHQIDMKGKIVMIEDINEEPYRIDRMLTQLISSGELTQAAGIVFGICRGCDKTDKTKTPNSFTLRQVIEDRIKPLNIPSAYGLSFGHNINNFTFPIGIKAEFDANNMTIQLMEKAVD